MKDKDVKNELRTQIIDFLPSYYMTLISIIQATSLGYLLVSFTSQYNKETLVSLQTITSIITFFLIIVVWNEYMMGSATIRWIPSLWDSIIPFFLGICQFLLVFSAGKANSVWLWYLSFCLLSIISFYAFLNMYQGAIKLRKYNNINEVVLKKIGKWRFRNYYGTNIYALIFLLFSLCEFYEKINSNILIIITIGLVFIFIIRGIYYWNRIIQLIK